MQTRHAPSAFTIFTWLTITLAAVCAVSEPDEIGVQGIRTRLVFGRPLSPEQVLDAATGLAENGYRGCIIASADHEGDAPLGDDLRDLGLTESFLCLELHADTPFLTDADHGEAVLDVFENEAHRAAAAELTGITFDSRSFDLPYSYHWDGYVWERHPPEELAERATAFGKRLLRAIRRNLPQGTILVQADALTTAGPLWFRLFDGMVEAARLARSEPPILVSRELATERDPVAIEARTGRINRLLRHHLSDENAAYWDRHADTVTLALDAGPGGSDWPLRVLAGRLASGRYLLAEGDGTAPPALMTPLDGYRYIGPLGLDTGDAAHVFADEAGAAMLLWQGLSGSIPLARCTPRVRNLVTGHERIFDLDDDAATLGPLVGPALVDRLSMRSWAVPACLWLDLEPAAPSQEVPVAYGFRNRLGFSFDGAVAATSERGFGILPNTAPVRLESGEALEVDGMLRGDLYPGRQFQVGLTAFDTGGDAVSRMFSYTAYPASSWEARFHGPIQGAPLVWRVEGRSLFVIAGYDGEIAAFTSQGALRWRQWLPTRFAHGPVATQYWDGSPMVVAVDLRGRLHAFNYDGGLQWEARPVARRPSSPPQRVNAHGFPGREVLVAYGNGMLACVLSNGQTLWERPIPGRNPRIAVGDITGEGRDSVVAVVEGAPRNLHVFRNDGRHLWSAESSIRPTTEPVLADVTGDGALEILIGGERGEIEVRDALWGRLHDRVRLRRQAPIAGLAVAMNPEDESRRIVAATALGLVCLDANLQTQWTALIASGAAPAVVEHDGPPYFVAPGLDGSVSFLTIDGAIEWTVPGSGAPIVASPVAGIFTPGGLFEAITVSTDHAIRAIPLE